MSLVGPPDPSKYSNFQDTKQIKLMNITFKNSINIEQYEKRNDTGDYFYVESFGLGNIVNNINYSKNNSNTEIRFTNLI